jgi:hypothetical protein
MAVAASSGTASVSPSASPDIHAPGSTLQRTRANLAFLYDPKTGPAPVSRRTRTFLRTAHYTLKFVFWRLVRWAKYAAIGSLTALVAGTAIGSIASGAAFVIAPPGILGGAAIGLLWGLGKYSWRWYAKRAAKKRQMQKGVQQPGPERIATSTPATRYPGLYSDPSEF